MSAARHHRVHERQRVRQVCANAVFDAEESSGPPTNRPRRARKQHNVGALSQIRFHLCPLVLVVFFLFEHNHASHRHNFFAFTQGFVCAAHAGSKIHCAVEAVCISKLHPCMAPPFAQATARSSGLQVGVTHQHSFPPRPRSMVCSSNSCVRTSLCSETSGRFCVTILTSPHMPALNSSTRHFTILPLVLSVTLNKFHCHSAWFELLEAQGRSGGLKGLHQFGFVRSSVFCISPARWSPCCSCVCGGFKRFAGRNASFHQWHRSFWRLLHQCSF